MKVAIQRVYDIRRAPPASAILVDRLWPRGISKETLQDVPWLTVLAPTDELRQWFHTNKGQRFEAFGKKFYDELHAHTSEIQDLIADYPNEITLLTAVKDIEKSHIPILKKFLEKM